MSLDLSFYTFLVAEAVQRWFKEKSYDTLELNNNLSCLRNYIKRAI